MTFPAGIAAARAAGVPLVVHVHATEHDRSPLGVNPQVKAVEQEGLDASDRVVTVSRYEARVLARHYRVDPAKVRVVHNAVSFRVGAPRRPKRRRGGPAGEPVVLFLGRITLQKGPQYFLQAAERVARAEPRVRFVMAGSGDLLAEMVEGSARRGLQRRLCFTGFLHGKEVARAFRMADVFVMPSLSEPFGIAPLEALAHGIPVIVSRRSGVAEVLPSAPRIDPRDVGALSRAILDLVRRPALRRRLVREGRREAAALRWDASARRLLAVYDEVLPGRGR
jgi:glycogen(starch) synthase